MIASQCSRITRELEGGVDLVYDLALILGFVAQLAVFRAALRAAFDYVPTEGCAVRRPATLVFSVALFCGSLYWLPELYVLPLAAASVALWQFVFPQSDPFGRLERKRLERRGGPPRQIARYRCDGCCAPVPDGMDRCPCCAERVPWTARAEELLPIPTAAGTAQTRSLPVPAEEEGWVRKLQGSEQAELGARASTGRIT